MLKRNGPLSVLLAASYLLAVGVSALFHDHRDHGDHRDRCECCDHHAHSDELPGRGYSAADSVDGQDCPICQFLAEKPVPVVLLVAPEVGLLVQDVAAAAPPAIATDVFSAWHSRAPPALG
jgi:hypothetical protein